MNIGQKVKIKGTNSVWDDKEGILEDVDGDTCTVFVDFIPSEHKRIRQDFNIDNIDFNAYNDNSEVHTMDEDLKLREDDIQDDDTQARIQALADYLGLDASDIELSSWGGGHNMITSEGEEYWVGTEEEAYDAAYDEIEQMWDDMGLELFSEDTKDFICSNFVDWEPIEDAKRESYEYYIEDIESESDSEFENRLVSEMYDAGILTDEDFEETEDGKLLNDDVNLDGKKEEFLDYLCENMDVQDWIDQIYTPEDFSKWVEDNGWIDVDGVIRYCIREDGIAHTLASYDFEEHDLGNDLYAYRRD